MSTRDVLGDWLRVRLPPDCGVAVRTVGAAGDDLFPQEVRLIARAGVKRRAEFQAGRAAAREALAAIGHAPDAIMAHEEGDPIWPVGVVGSITHTDTWALAVASSASGLFGVGVDLESDEPLEPDLAARICRPEELAAPLDLAPPGIDGAKLRFVAKEAFYKAVFPRWRRFIGFEAVTITFQARQGRFEARFMGAPERGAPKIPSRATGFYLHTVELLCAVCTVGS